MSVPLEQSDPVQWPLQTHFWVSKSNSPWPEQSGKHCLASWSIWAQLVPLQPFRHTQLPSTQNPWPEQVGSSQSAVMKILSLSLKIEFYNFNKLYFSLIWIYLLDNSSLWNLVHRHKLHCCSCHFHYNLRFHTHLTLIDIRLLSIRENSGILHLHSPRYLSITLDTYLIKNKVIINWNKKVFKMT